MNPSRIARTVCPASARRRWTRGTIAATGIALLSLVAGACGQSSYSRLLLTGTPYDAEVGNPTGLGDGSVEHELGTGGGDVGGVGAATGGAGTAPSSGGAPGIPPGTGGAGFGSGGSGGANQTASGGAGPPASGGTGSGGAHSGGATIMPPASGGAFGSGGLGTGGAQTGGATVVHTGGATGTGGRTGTGGATGTGGSNVGSDTARYNFESSSQGWGMAAGGDPFSSVGRSTAQHVSGSASLAGSLSATSGKTYILEVTPPVPAIPAGATVTFHVYVPSIAQLGSVQPYVLNDVFKFVGANTASASLKRDGWTTIVLSVPASETNVTRLGVQFASSGSWTGTVYVDSIDW